MYLDPKKHQDVTLPPIGSWPAADHSFETESIWAINAALASRRPLLVRGEPGTGKSQLARAAAAALGRVPLSYVVNARTESRDLQYHYDALARLAEAQTATLTQKKDQEAQDVLSSLHPKHFLAPGVLWWAFNWGNAEKQHHLCRSAGAKPEPPGPATLGDGSKMHADIANGTVVLIDEIDKADSDVPNGLLETLGNGGFSVPYINQAVIATHPFPLVILTTNGDRELPPAFLRRCLILRMQFSKDEGEFVTKLTNRGRRRYGQRLPDGIYEKVAKELWTDRITILTNQRTGPGQAEYFDMLEALVNLKEDNDVDPDTALDGIAKFMFKKFAAEN